MIQKLKIYIKKKLRIYNFNKNINLNILKKQKKILISYVNPYFSGITYDKHTNVKEAIQIIKSFIDKGFVIDIIDVGEQNYKSVIRSDYDVIFGLGASYLEACRLNPNALKILYLTENHPCIVKDKFKERQFYYKERHGSVKTGIIRNNYFNNEQISNSDICIAINNNYNAQNIPKDLKTYLIKPTGFINPYFLLDKKDSNSKLNFLWFGSAGALHKGLDLLIDAFEKSDLNLHICGLNNKEKYFLTSKSKNIINHGFLDPFGKSFLKIVQQCAFIIFPSCSEGISTSVVTCMLHGLIPVVTKEAGIDIEDFGYEINSYLVEDIAELVQNLSLISDEELNERSKKAYDHARKYYTLKNFTESFNFIVDDILTKFL